jgi:hypothetical protein
MKELNLCTLRLENYNLAANFSRNNHTGGGICIFSRADLQVKTTNLSQFWVERNFEICSLQLE